MSYYIQLDGEYIQGIWSVQDARAVRFAHPLYREKGGTPQFVERGSTGDIWNALRAKFPEWFEGTSCHSFERMDLVPGQYFPRMARPDDREPEPSPGIYPGAKQDVNEIASYRGQLRALMRQLEHICQTVHPCTQTLSMFGHDIRNLLILACTEVEAHLKGILLANNYPDGRLSTNDYVKLAVPMRFAEYSVNFPLYPWLSPIRPFDRWGLSGRPSQELDWYVAYNAVKHDREREFERATLKAAFTAVTACAVLMWARFGEKVGGDGLGYFFNLVDVPKWRPTELYISPYKPYASGWTPQNYPL
jgi:hypothetical protein